MGHYYFHFLTAQGVIEDDVGIEFHGVRDAFVVEAVQAALEIATEMLACGDEQTVVALRVVDSLARPVFELPLNRIVSRTRGVQAIGTPVFFSDATVH